MTCITVTGEALIDFIPDEHGELHQLPGGSGLNTALALARLGARTSFAAALSTDKGGEQLVRCLHEDSVDLSSAHRSAKPCPRVLISKDAQGVPSYDLHLAGSALEDAPVQWTFPQGTCHFHATSFAATLGAGGEATLATLRQARPLLSTSFDPNIRTAVFPDRSAIPLLLAQRIRHADFVKLSSEDLDAIAPGILHDHVIGEWRALGVRLLIVTRGAKGALAFFGEQQIDMPAPTVDVCDTVGAGDTFMGALLAAMAREKCLGQLPPSFSPEQVARWMHFANAAAALCCTRPGANPPTSADMSAHRAAS